MDSRQVWKPALMFLNFKPLKPYLLIWWWALIETCTKHVHILPLHLFKNSEGKVILEITDKISRNHWIHIRNHRKITRKFNKEFTEKWQVMISRNHWKLLGITRSDKKTQEITVTNGKIHKNLVCFCLCVISLSQKLRTPNLNQIQCLVYLLILYVTFFLKFQLKF